MTLHTLLDDLRGDPRFMATVAAWRTLPAQRARYAPAPPDLHPALAEMLRQRGIDPLYTHQAEAVAHALAGANTAVVTPTASGKTLCYNLPVFHTLLGDTDARALYLFPTKALAHDQLAELHRLAAHLTPSPSHPLTPSPSHPLTVAAYDGDTPTAERSRIRKTARIVLTNPDMLHVGILPYHLQWADFLGGLRWVVVDEMHTYRGVFGSQVANVLRRLRRLCAHYGATPRFICTSATIANPVELAERLIEQPVTLIDDNGAPRGARQVILVNPPLLDAERGIRRSATLETADLAARCIDADLQTIVFGRARQTTELLLTYVRERAPGRRNAIRGYRGGYLPTERRTIEAGLRGGAVCAVVATNALELGIDIGQLQAALICGYPGAIASLWQQMGRAGRGVEGALAILVATADPLDQHLIQHVDYLFERSPEHALINPDNLLLLLDQVRCAAFEAPFALGERLGSSPLTDDVLALLEEEGEVRRHGDQFFWGGESYPARSVSLRSAGADNVVIQAQAPDAAPTVVGVVDPGSAPLLVHEGAIYLHEGQSYEVRRLDLEARIATVTPVQVDFYTQASTEHDVAVTAIHGERTTATVAAAFGEVTVTAQVVGFRRIRRGTHETLGVQPLTFPPTLLDTAAYWFAVQPAAQAQLASAGLWFDSVNDYGPNWQAQRARVRARDRYRCTACGQPEAPGQEHDVHHRIPFRTFGYVAGVNEHYLSANQLDNLVLLCRGCHRRLETAGRLRTGLDGLAYALANLAPLFLMCDRSDLGVFVARSDPGAAVATASQATLYLFERVPAGLGFSAQLFDLHDELLAAARERIAACPCRHGCPACVGPVLEDQPHQLETKRLTMGMVEILCS
jgi:DEAD/DEAH box helicase domain-containing protein